MQQHTLELCKIRENILKRENDENKEKSSENCCSRTIQ